MNARYIATALVLMAGLFLATPRTHAADKDNDKKDKTVIGTDKNTGGEAPGDRQKVEDIQRGAEDLKNRMERERQERQKQREKQQKADTDKNQSSK